MKYAHLLGIIAIPAIVIGGVCWRFSRTETAKLSDLRWAKNAPTFVIEKEAAKKAYTGPLFIRLRDGKDQFIAGNWDLSFDESNIFAYGNFAKSTSTADATSTSIFSPTTGPYVLRIDEDAIAILEQKKLNGKALSGINSLNGSYIGLTIDSKDHPFCVIETTADQKDRPCIDVPVDQTDEVAWNPMVDHEIVTRSATGSIATIDLWDGSAMHKNVLTRVDNQKKYDTLTHAFPAKQDEQTKIQRAMGVTAIRNEKGWHFFRLPSDARVTMLSDENHLLIQEKNDLQILEISTKKIAPLYHEDGIGQKEILSPHSSASSL